MNKKYVVIALLVIVVGFGAALFAKTELFQGSMRFRPVSNLIYSWHDFFASPVASPVPSVIVSEVPSGVPSEVPSTTGPSIVTSWVPSMVPSVVVSSVASAVALNAKDAAKVNPKKVKKLTAKVLTDFAKQDFKRNPDKYSLTWKEKDKILKLYEMKKMKSSK